MNNFTNLTMKTFKLICCAVIAVLLSACVQQSYLPKSVWINVVETQASAEQAALITSLEFKTDKDVDIYHSVANEEGIAVTPFKYAKGTYITKGNPKKEAIIEIAVKSIEGDSLKYKGVYRKNKAIILESEEHIVKAYGKSSLKLP